MLYQQEHYFLSYHKPADFYLLELIWKEVRDFTYVWFYAYTLIRAPTPPFLQFKKPVIDNFFI